MTFIEKVTQIQKNLKAPKNRRNSYGNYNYRSCEDILEAVKPLCAEAGLMLTISDEPIEVSGWHYIKATATLTDGENSISVSASAREADDKKGMDPSQQSGSCSSYARKYCLNGLFLTDDTKDADTDEYSKETKNKAKYPSAEEKGRLIQIAKKLGVDINSILEQAGWVKDSKLTYDAFEKAEIILKEIEQSREA